MKKTLLSALALSLFAAAPALAQTTPTMKSDDDKTKTSADGMTVKTKMADDGKMKMKGKDEAGNSIKSTTKPMRGDMKGDMKMDHKGMHHKDMKKDKMIQPAAEPNGTGM